MAELKTKETQESFVKFLNTIEDEAKRKDCLKIAEMMKQVSKCEPKMWGTAIIGFGSYHYKYESGHEGDMCIVGFSPRKKNIALYISGGINDHLNLLDELGKYKRTKGCLYINKLEDVNTEALKKLIKASYAFIRNKYP